MNKKIRDILSASPTWNDLEYMEQERIINNLLDIIKKQYCLKNNK
jgi:hypothetical protein